MEHISTSNANDFIPIVKNLQYISQRGEYYYITIYGNGGYKISEPRRTVYKWVKDLSAAYTQEELKEIDPDFMRWLVRQLRIYYDKDLKVFLNQSCD